ncbi:PaaI family thioesterase [Ferrimicrobium sp.]|uniref:PaaI family thioesterase n=1 Tax=Ferrimicrobium sp. TaxID=2926050 RepID=UPI002606A799|nr:PaaI family thioesterase [Ferrimicrobium sp.]
MGEANCFACGASNPIGLHLAFSGTDGIVQAKYQAERRFVGWDDVLHGGITATILDEAASYVPYSMGYVTVTARLEVRYSLPIRVDEVLLIEGRFLSQRRKVVEAESEIRDEQGVLRASAMAKLMILGERSASGTGASALL